MQILHVQLQRQKAAKKGAAQSAEWEAEDADPSQHNPAPPAQYMSAHLESLLYPGAPAAAAGAASQYPLGVPLPGQGTPAAALAQQQAATQHGIDYSYMHDNVRLCIMSTLKLCCCNELFIFRYRHYLRKFCHVVATPYACALVNLSSCAAVEPT